MKTRLYNKSLFKIFLSLFIILLMMFSLSFFIFRNSVNGIYRQINENNKIVFNGVANSFDSCFKEINNIIFSMNELPYNSLYYLGTDAVDYYEFHMIYQKLSNMVNNIDYIEDVIIFSDKSDFIISSSGTMSLSSLIASKFKSNTYSAEFWRSFASIKHPFKVFPSSEFLEYDINQWGTDKLLDSINKRKLIAVLGSNKLDISRLNILVFINEDKLLKFINHENMVKGSSMIVLNEDKSVILSKGDISSNSDIVNLFMEQESGTSITQDKYRYYMIKSNYNNFVYINRIPYSLDDMFQTVKVNRIVMSSAIVIGILLTVLLTLYLYRPIDKIAKLIIKKEEVDSSDKLSTIYSSISNIKNENIILKKHFDEIEQDIIRSVFLKMVDDYTYQKKISAQVESYFKMIFTGEKFFIASFVLVPCPGTVKPNSDIDISAFHDAMVNKINDALFNKFDKFSVFNIEGMKYIALISLRNELEHQEISKNIKFVFDNFRKNVSDDYSIIMVISKFYKEISDCKSAYKDIKTCMAYRKANTIDEIIYADNIKYNGYSYYPMDLINKLQGYLLSSDANACKELINDIIHENIVNGVSYNKFQGVISGIINVIINTLTSCEYDIDEIEEIEKSFYDEITDLFCYKDMQAFLNKIIDKVTEEIKLEDNKKIDKNFIIKYIHMHYAENLYLDNMAALAGTSPKYFSKFFKKAFGVNFVDYLNKTRINHAKEYLKNENATISEIAEKTGYFNANTFTSTFKKYCGISPSEYRKNNTQS